MTTRAMGRTARLRLVVDWCRRVAGRMGLERPWLAAYEVQAHEACRPLPLGDRRVSAALARAAVQAGAAVGGETFRAELRRLGAQLRAVS